MLIDEAGSHSLTLQFSLRHSVFHSCDIGFSYAFIDASMCFFLSELCHGQGGWCWYYFVRTLIFLLLVYSLRLQSNVLQLRNASCIGYLETITKNFYLHSVTMYEYYIQAILYRNMIIQLI